MLDALLWLLAIEILGLIALPLTFRLFRRLPDRGIALSKLLGLLLCSYVLWVLGLAHVLPNSFYSIVGILAIMALASALVLRHSMPDIIRFLRGSWGPVLVGELVFLGFYFLWLAVVSSAPAINHTEKPMDFAFLNSILRSSYFPPEDPWLAGHSISYYYFGHFMMAFLTKLTAIPSSVAYNLSIALIPALLAAGAFSLVYNLVRLSGGRARTAVLFALAAPAFIGLIGNLEGVLELFHAREWGPDGFWEWVSIKGLDGAQEGEPSIFPRAHWWWWHSTRVIDTVVDGNSLDYTITEFPFFSFLLGDLHAHVSALPFLVLNLALGLNLFLSKERLGLSWLRRNPWEVLALALSLGALAFINIWDFPVFAAILVALVLVKGLGDWGGYTQRSLLPSLYVLAPMLVGSVVMFLPFYLTLASQASGILPVGEHSTRPFFFFLIWGLFLVLTGTYLLRQLGRVPGLTGRYPGILGTTIVITLLPALLWAGIELLVSPFDDGIVNGLHTVAARLGKVLPGLAIVAIAIYSALLRVLHGNGRGRATAFTLVLLAMAFYLLVGAELFYVADFFGNRMNTMFKVYFQAWLLLAIVSAYSLYYLCSRPVPSLSRRLGPLRAAVRVPVALASGVGRYGWAGAVAVLFLASIYYPVGAALDKARGSGDTTLDGLAFLRGENSGEYAAITWLRDEAPRGRIVEAVGDDYSPFGRVSSSTGLPTLLGWKGHEHQWRGSTRAFRGREGEVESIYRNEDADEVLRLLQENDIRYVYVGPRERATYGGRTFDRFCTFLKPVFHEKDVVIYERLPGEEGTTMEERDCGGTS